MVRSFVRRVMSVFFTVYVGDGPKDFIYYMGCEVFGLATQCCVFVIVDVRLLIGHVEFRLHVCQYDLQKRAILSRT